MSSQALHVIDRFGGDLAVIETPHGFHDVPRSRLPKNARPGDHLSLVKGEGSVRYRVDRKATAQARQRNQSALDDLNGQDEGGDVKL